MVVPPSLFLPLPTCGEEFVARVSKRMEEEEEQREERKAVFY